MVDWKTNRSADLRPVQLALYRLAWAELAGVPLERVRAAFYYVRSGDLVEPADLARPRCAGAGVRGGGVSLRSAAVSAISTISPKVCSRSAAVVSSPVTMWSETVQIASALRPCFAASV